MQPNRYSSFALRKHTLRALTMDRQTWHGRLQKRSYHSQLQLCKLEEPADSALQVGGGRPNMRHRAALAPGRGRGTKVLGQVPSFSFSMWCCSRGGAVGSWLEVGWVGRTARRLADCAAQRSAQRRLKADGACSNRRATHAAPHSQACTRLQGGSARFEGKVHLNRAAVHRLHLSAGAAHQVHVWCGRRQRQFSALEAHTHRTDRQEKDTACACLRLAHGLVCPQCHGGCAQLPCRMGGRSRHSMKSRCTLHSRTKRTATAVVQR